MTETCWICEAKLPDSKTASQFGDGIITNRKFQSSTNKPNYLCEFCSDELYLAGEKLRREIRIAKQDEKDGGEQRALNTMERGICAAETNYGDD